MGSYVFKRIFLLIPVLLVISTITFLLMHAIPGDPAEVILGFETVDPVKLEEVRRTLGLDRPLYEQYTRWLFRAATGDFGTSPRTGRPVLSMVLEAMPFTIELALYALFLVVSVGIPLGTVGAATSSRAIAGLVQLTTLLGLSLPSFWVGALLILLFSVRLRLFPLLQYPSFFSSPLGNLWGFFLPALTLALPSIASIIRMTRACVLESAQGDYVKTARAKGLSERAVLFRHMLRTAMIPIITSIGITAGYLIGGAIVVEQVFAVPGLGRLGAQAIVQRDYPLLQAVVLFSAVGFAVSNLVVDILYVYFNPKIRYA
ncbi:MAG: ABC transporter permease [Candidatus Acetothermia bacterium]|nr:ABC transporter permease [Candidatus Acetothermia bacterium]